MTTEKKEETEMKTLTVDATAYNQWVYVNLKNGKTQTVTMEGSDDESAVTVDWQIAHTSLYGSKNQWRLCCKNRYDGYEQGDYNSDRRICRR